jgi:hypothetical protein
VCYGLYYGRSESLKKFEEKPILAYLFVNRPPVRDFHRCHWLQRRRQNCNHFFVASDFPIFQVFPIFREFLLLTASYSEIKSELIKIPKMWTDRMMGKNLRVSFSQKTKKVAVIKLFGNHSTLLHGS